METINSAIDGVASFQQFMRQARGVQSRAPTSPSAPPAAKPALPPKRHGENRAAYRARVLNGAA